MNNKGCNYCKFCKCDFAETYYKHMVDPVHRELLVKNYYEVIKHQYSSR